MDANKHRNAKDVDLLSAIGRDVNWFHARRFSVLINQVARQQSATPRRLAIVSATSATFQQTPHRFFARGFPQTNIRVAWRAKAPLRKPKRKQRCFASRPIAIGLAKTRWDAGTKARCNKSARDPQWWGRGSQSSHTPGADEMLANTAAAFAIFDAR